MTTKAQLTQLAERVPHDAHVQVAHKAFRDCGFTIAAMQYPRCAEALAGLKRFNRLPADAKVPPAWHYFPNAYMRDNWRKYYGTARAAECGE